MDHFLSVRKYVCNKDTTSTDFFGDIDNSRQLFDIALHCDKNDTDFHMSVKSLPSYAVHFLQEQEVFKNARQLAAWLGLVPRQHSSGGKPLLLGISKRGDTYLRTLLILGARAVLRVAERKVGPVPSWLAQLTERRHTNVAAVALANKNARIVWALLAHERNYQADYTPSAV